MRLNPDAGGSAGGLRLAALALAVMIAVSYLPAIRGGFIWDDNSYLTGNPSIRSVEGLRSIWVTPGATPQYYPLVFTGFWVEYRLWGLHPLGYHLSNVALHIANSLLLWWVLRFLAVPGAWLTAAVWGLHPLNVESVAWITERKNVLSGFFYLSAFLAFLRLRADCEAAGDRSQVMPSGWRRRYLVAFGLFVCALLSKSVTATLPMALALVWWWKGKRIREREMLALLPLVVIGAVYGGVTVWMEKFHVGARGEEWALSVFERVLVAGRALWFYAGKIVWPADLTFIYPRWELQSASWGWFLFPVLAAGTVAVLWRLRTRVGKGPLTAVLFFAGTLLPALGFFDIYPMRYTFVADHYTYLGSIGLIALAVALFDQSLAGRVPRAAGLAVLIPLGLLTWNQGKIYRNAETLWRDTLAKNPGAWIAHNNLGANLTEQKKYEEAAVNLEKALEVNPELALPRLNLGRALLAKGKVAKALEHYRIAVKLKPEMPSAHLGLGAALERAGQEAQAVTEYEEALRLKPESVDARYRLARISFKRGELPRATSFLLDLLKRRPSHAPAHALFGDVLAARGNVIEAEGHFRQAILINPRSFNGHLSLGVLLARKGDLEGAAFNLSRAVSLRPNSATANYNLGKIDDLDGKTAEAVRHYRRAIAANPKIAEAHNNLGADLLLLGKTAEGEAHLREALRLQPGFDEARKNLELSISRR
ncbi:MAG: tetratricopeptide repeat protein [Candidatus Methylomirabilia bacterium]